MRLSLLLHPRALLERLALESVRRRRLGRLRGTVASELVLGHIDSLELLEMLEPAPRVIYDVGANVGSWALLAKAVHGAAVLHAFEPLPSHHAEFVRGAARLDGVRLHRVALGARRATMPIHVASFSDASSMLAIAPAATEQWAITESRQEEVPVVPLDDYVAEAGLPLPDLIKLDVQGYELVVLAAAERCLAHARYVLTEVSFVEFYHGQALFHDVVRFLGEHGFQLEALSATTPVGVPLAQTDVLFRRRG